MTINELKACRYMYVTLDDICGDILPICSRTLKKQINQDSENVDFPMFRVGRRVFIPRVPFIRYIEEGVTKEKQPTDK